MLIIGCAKNQENQIKANDVDIAAAATAKIYRACKYPNGKFCENSCCQIEEKCNIKSAYKNCDLETGEWQNEIYSDHDCNSKCNKSAKEDVTKTSNKALNPQSQITCLEGWRCFDKRNIVYQYANCSFGETKPCDNGCYENSCKKLCNPNELKCDNGVLKICNDEGTYWSYHETCENGCENGNCILLPLGNQQNDSAETNNPEQQQNTTNQNICDSSCISIIDFHYAAGNDCKNLNGEYVVFKNTCKFSCDLTGWNVKDASTHSYVFKTFILESDSAFTLYTGSGTDTSTEIYWNSKGNPCNAIWNNDKDTLYLRNSNNDLVLSYSYP